jgi:hypothetical protein
VLNDGVKQAAAGDAVVFDHTAESKGGSRATSNCCDFQQGMVYQYPLLDGPNLNTNGFAGGRESGGGEEVTEHFQGDHVTFCGACEGRRESTEAA